MAATAEKTTRVHAELSPSLAAQLDQIKRNHDEIERLEKAFAALKDMRSTLEALLAEPAKAETDANRRAV